MHRRQVLASVGIALSSGSAGCLDRWLGDRRARQQVSLTDVEAVGEEHPLRLDAALRSRAMGPETAPELDITLRSTTGDALFLGYADSWPADGLLPDRNSDPRGVRLLADAEVSELTVEFGACPYTAFHPITEEARAGHRVAPGAEITGRYHVLGSAPTPEDACPEARRYRFRSPYVYARAAAVERVGFEAAEQRRFSWGFTVELQGNA